MNDSQMLTKLRQIDALNQQISHIILEIENSGHQNADKIAGDLRDNLFDNAAWAEHCFHPKSPKWQIIPPSHSFSYRKGYKSDLS